MTEVLIGARYRLDELIGRGGMATVWRASDTLLGRSVAIKRLHPGMIADEELAERFRREALLVARLSHPNLVHVLDRGEDERGPYLVLELVEGEDLKTRLRRDGPLDPSEAASICAQVGRALAYAHAQGVVHRDIKAQNVLITDEGVAKLADFGIARMIEADGQPGLTRTDMLLGSADYLSPEQADGRPLDARTDIYSLGIVLYECLTGELPFRGEGFVAVAMKHCAEPLPDPREISPEVPAWLAACAIRATEKDADLRFANANAMVSALEGEPQDDDAGTAIMPTVPRGPVRIEDRMVEPPPPPRRGRAILFTGVGAVLVALIATAAILLLSGGGEDDAQPSGPLTISAVQDYDPEGGGDERRDLKDLAVDGNPGTAWYTERYQASAEFGGLKSGVGLILRLREAAQATELVVSSPTVGAHFQLLGPLVNDSRRVLAEGNFTGDTQRVELETDEPVQSYVLWITRLVPDGDGRYYAGVGEVSLLGVAKTS